MHSIALKTRVPCVTSVTTDLGKSSGYETYLKTLTQTLVAIDFESRFLFCMPIVLVDVNSTYTLICIFFFKRIDSLLVEVTREKVEFQG